MELQEIIGRRIAQLRKEKLKLSQQKFSYEAGIERSYLTRIENGKKNISVNTLERLIKALGVSFTEFFNSKEFLERSGNEEAKSN